MSRVTVGKRTHLVDPADKHHDYSEEQERPEEAEEEYAGSRACCANVESRR